MGEDGDGVGEDGEELGADEFVFGAEAVFEAWVEHFGECGFECGV